MEWDIIQKSWK